MSINGFGAAKQKIYTVASNLRDASVLIGQRKESPIQLETDNETILPGLGLETEANILQIRSQNTQKGIFNLLVLGEFKNGKSTLINALLGSQTLPAKVIPTTAIITVLVSGEREEVAIYKKDSKEPDFMSLESFQNQFSLNTQDVHPINGTPNFNRFENINYAQLECQHAICANGVKIIDSPGLEENQVRTELTLSWREQSQAIIFVLNAIQPLTQAERQFITDLTQNQNQLNNVFLVINRINQVNRNEVNEIKQRFEIALMNCFLNENGQFDQQLYNRRVFFVNAQGALDARTSTPPNTDLLQETGVLDLENALERFLTSDEKFQAAFSSDIEALQRFICKGCQEIFFQKNALNLQLTELETNQSKGKQLFRQLNNRKKNIERLIDRSGDIISEKIHNNLLRYTRDLVYRSRDLQDSLNLEQLSIGLVTKAIINDETKKDIKELTELEVEKYLQAKFTEWADGLPTVLEENIETMKNDIEEEIGNFQLELVQLKSIFSGVTITNERLDIERTNSLKIAQLVLGAATLDPGGLVGSLMSTGNWQGLLRQIGFQIISIGGGYLIGLSIGGPLGAIILGIITDLVHIRVAQNLFVNRLREKIAQRVQEELPQIISDKRKEISQLVKAQFTELAQCTTRMLQQQIDQISAEQERIISQKRDAAVSADREQQRLDRIGEKLIELYDRVNFEVFQKRLTDQEIQNFQKILQRSGTGN